jgi:hypothetical protein
MCAPSLWICDESTGQLRLRLCSYNALWKQALKRACYRCLFWRFAFCVCFRCAFAAFRIALACFLFALFNIF